MGKVKMLARKFIPKVLIFNRCEISFRLMNDGHFILFYYGAASNFIEIQNLFIYPYTGNG